MAKKSEPAKPVGPSVYCKIASKAVWPGEVGALDKAAAIEKIQAARREADGAIRNGRIVWRVRPKRCRTP
jgi:hypothetical protein